MTFRLEIKLDNAVMQTDADLADALSSVIDRLDRRAAGSDLYGFEGSIRDANGNTVGRFMVEDNA